MSSRGSRRGHEGAVRFSNTLSVMADDDEEALVPESAIKETRISLPQPAAAGMPSDGLSTRYKLTIAGFGVVAVGLVLFAAFSPSFVASEGHEIAIFSKDTKRLKIYKATKDEFPVVELSMANNLDQTLDIHGPYRSSSAGGGTSDTYVWKDGAGESVANMTILAESNSSCVTVQWHSYRSALFQPSYNDCVALGSAQWYGGGELYTQHWPLQTGRINATAFVSHDILNDPARTVFGSALEPLFFSSGGLVLRVNDSAPLFVSLAPSLDERGTGASLCLLGKYDEDTYPNIKSASDVGIQYSICMREDPVDAFKFLSSSGFLPKPKQTPDLNMLRNPIWSTALSIKDFNSSAVIDLANEIRRNGFRHSVMEIDSQYMRSYGDFVFDNRTVPDPVSLFRELHSLNFSTSLWQSPFINVDSNNFDFAVANGYLVRGSNGQVNLVKWWNGFAGVIDVTQPNASAWFVAQLQRLRRSGVDSFQFHCGEVEYLPLQHITAQPLHNPNIFSQRYVRTGVAVGGDLSVTRSAYRLQRLGSLVAIMDRQFTWGLDSGLHSLVTTTLTLSVLGYPFSLGDFVGGQVGRAGRGSALPDPELFVRWAQLTAFLPAMQFATPPWWYSGAGLAGQVVRLSREAVELHARLSELLLEGLASAAVTTGLPIVRPLWWIAPADAAALSTNTQFLLGDAVMVVAVVRPLSDASVQSVYVPEGCWQHCNGTVFYSGGRAFSERLSLNYIPYLCRLQTSAPTSSGCATAATGGTFCSALPCSS